MSSIFDALRKLEDEKGDPKSGGLGEDLFRRRPGRGGSPRRRWAVVVIAALIVLGGAAYLWAKRGGEEPRGETAALMAGLGSAAAPAKAPSAGPGAVAPAAPGAPAAAQRAPAVRIPTNIMTEEQKKAREKMLANFAALRGGSARGEAGEGAPTPAPPAPPAAVAPVAPPAQVARVAPPVPLAPVAPPAAVAPATGAPPPAPAPAPTREAPIPGVAAVPAVPSPPVAEQAAPRSRVVQVEPPTSAPPVAERAPGDVPPSAVTAPAVTGKAKARPLLKSEFPMLTVTEVTFHPKRENRSARIRIGDGSARLVHEGDEIRGVRVGEILSGAVSLEMAGTDVVVDVGESVSFSVSEPDFH